MKTLFLMMELTYDPGLIHGPGSAGFRAFKEGVLEGKDLILVDTGGLCDTIGSVKVLLVLDGE